MYIFTSFRHLYIVKSAVGYCYYANNSYLCSMFWWQCADPSITNTAINYKTIYKYN